MALDGESSNTSPLHDDHRGRRLRYRYKVILLVSACFGAVIYLSYTSFRRQTSGVNTQNEIEHENFGEMAEMGIVPLIADSMEQCRLHWRPGRFSYGEEVPCRFRVFGSGILSLRLSSAHLA